MDDEDGIDSRDKINKNGEKIVTSLDLETKWT